MYRGDTDQQRLSYSLLTWLTYDYVLWLALYRRWLRLNSCWSTVLLTLIKVLILIDVLYFAVDLIFAKCLVLLFDWLVVMRPLVSCSFVWFFVSFLIEYFGELIGIILHNNGVESQTVRVRCPSLARGRWQMSIASQAGKLVADTLAPYLWHCMPALRAFEIEISELCLWSSWMTFAHFYRWNI